MRNAAHRQARLTLGFGPRRRLASGRGAVAVSAGPAARAEVSSTISCASPRIIVAIRPRCPIQLTFPPCHLYLGGCRSAFVVCPTLAVEMTKVAQNHFVSPRSRWERRIGWWLCPRILWTQRQRAKQEDSIQNAGGDTRTEFATAMQAGIADEKRRRDART